MKMKIEGSQYSVLGAVLLTAFADRCMTCDV